jgi:SlyX protein
VNESIQRLEEKIAFLERHVTEQDKAMLEFAEGLAALRREMKTLRERAAGGGGAGAESDGEAADERPPHY